MVSKRQEAVRHFGITEDVMEAGFILTDGKLLDFSEKKEGGYPGSRQVDHFAIGAIYEDKTNAEAFELLNDF